jgi:hypothetical protein
VLYDSTIPYDVRFFRALDRFVQHEPWLDRDKVMIDMLKTLGIEKGKPFKPNAAAEATLNEAAEEARALLDGGYEAVFSPPYFSNSHWALPASKEVAEGMPTFFSDPNSYPIDGRGVTYSMAYFSAKHLGTGQFYLMTIKDKDDNSFNGANTYRLTVPPNAPIKLYWSATAYDRATHTLIRNLPRASRASNSAGLMNNKDGSTDVYFGPKAPRGKDSNWIPTGADGDFEVLFRFYGPQKPLFDKTWELPDIEKMS